MLRRAGLASTTTATALGVLALILTGVAILFNRARYDADQTVTAFAARLKDAVDLDSVGADLATVVSRALEPAHLSIWLTDRD